MTREKVMEQDESFAPMQFIPGGEGGETRLRLSDASLDVGQVHVDQTLTNVSVAYQNAAFIAEDVAPVVPVNMKSNKYFVYGKERFRRRMTSREPGDKIREAGWSLSQDSYFCQGHSLRGWYPWEAPSNADPVLDLDIDTTETTTDQVLLAQEMDLMDTITAGLVATDMGNDGGDHRVDNPDFDPIAYFDKKQEVIAKAIGKRANTIAFGRPGFRGFRSNPNVIRRVFGTTAPTNPLITPQMLAEKLDLQEVLVGEALYDTAAEGQATAALDYIWGTNVLLFYKDAQPGRRKVSFMYHFLWNVGNAGRIVEKFYDQDRKRYIIDVTKYRDQKIVASGAGLLFSNSLQTP